MRIVTVDEMRQIEGQTIEEAGLSAEMITENVAQEACSFIIANALNELQTGEITFLIGQGNNGADGLAIARHLSNQSYKCRAFMLFPKEECNPKLVKQAELAQNFGVRFSEIRNTEQLESYFTQTQDSHLVIDAILGIGFTAPLSNYLFDICNIVNQNSTTTISLDIPSGVDCDNGSISGTSIESSFTLAIGLPKMGSYIDEGAKRSGKVFVLDGGFPKTLLSNKGDKWLLGINDLKNFQDNRSKFSHKNNFGHCLIVGGSPGLTGAVTMASTAALKVGTGLVTASTWSDSYQELCSRCIPEVMTGLIPTQAGDVEDIIKNLKRWDSIVIGPGLGRTLQARETLLHVLNHFAGPVVIDADALRLLDLDEDASIISQRTWPVILTPHMGEFAGLAKVEKEKVLENPIGFLKEMIEKLNCSIVLKGSCSYIGFPSGDVFVNYFPNDGLASGGSGDVLTGFIGGLLAHSRMEVKSSSMFADKSVIYDSVKFGVIVHTLAGKYAANELGPRFMTAGNIIDFLPEAFKEVEGQYKI